MPAPWERRFVPARSEAARAGGLSGQTGGGAEGGGQVGESLRRGEGEGSYRLSLGWGWGNYPPSCVGGGVVIVPASVGEEGFPPHLGGGGWALPHLHERVSGTGCGCGRGGSPNPLCLGGIGGGLGRRPWLTPLLGVKGSQRGAVDSRGSWVEEKHWQPAPG